MNLDDKILIGQLVFVLIIIAFALVILAFGKLERQAKKK